MVQCFTALVLCISALVASTSHAQETAGLSLTNPPQPIRSVTEADVFIRDVFSALDVERYEEAASAYLLMLSRVGESQSQEEAEILARHLRAVAIVLPKNDLERIGIALEESSETLLASLSPEAGKLLTRWWRSQDNLPSTPANERLEEHLERYVSALDTYGNERDPRGYDDRGEIYIRLGEPSHQTEIELKSIDLQLNAQGLSVPANEFWVYRHVAYDAQYLFAEKRKGYGFQLGLPLDLIPRNLQNSRRHVGMLLAWMEEVYGQLALYHSNYGQRFDQVAGYRTLPGAGSARPDIFARSVLNTSHTEDLQSEWQRSENVPTSHSNNYGLARHLSVQFRTARFLNEDGTTRTELYWSTNGEALKLARRLVRRLYKEGHEASEDYLLSVYATRRNIDLIESARFEKHYVTTTDATGRIPTRALAIPGDSSDFSLALQWEQRWTLPPEPPDNTTRPGARLKIAVHTLDSLQALNAGGLDLEMSDLKPVTLGTNLSPQAGAPYALASLPPATPIALYFEVYHLAFDEDDQTRYTVAYEVAPYGKQENAETRASTSFSGDSRTARDYIIPDLSSEDINKGVEITLRITDEVTGRQISRSISFGPIP